MKDISAKKLFSTTETEQRCPCTVSQHLPFCKAATFIPLDLSHSSSFTEHISQRCTEILYSHLLRNLF